MAIRLRPLLFIILDNYQPQLSLCNGGTSQSFEWGKKYDVDERWKFCFRFNMGILKGRVPELRENQNNINTH